MPRIDLTGKEYEYYKVIDRNEARTRQNGKNVFWNCKCHCGKEFVATTTDINRQKTKSCGCMAHYLTGKAHFQDITGEVFGELEVLERDLERTQLRKKAVTYWKCKCSCGNIVSVERTHLVNRGQSSCGCKKSIGELNINKILSQNSIKYSTQYTNKDLTTDKGGYMKYDFAIFDDDGNLVRLIEFDGPQHNKDTYDRFFEAYEEIHQRDKLKNNYCKTHNIPLVRIPYNKRDTMTLEDLMGDRFLI